MASIAAAVCRMLCTWDFHMVSTVTEGCDVGTDEGWALGVEVGKAVGLRVRMLPLIRGADEVGTLVLGVLVG